MAADVKGIIYGINGPVIYIKGKTAFRMGEMVYVGPQKLVGEVIRLDSSRTTIQVYEETTGLKPGDEVYSTGAAISVTLAPGILHNIFDGIERPLSEIAKAGGMYITRGLSVDALDRNKKWQAHITYNPLKDEAHYYTIEMTKEKDVRLLGGVTEDAKHVSYGNAPVEGAELQEIMNLAKNPGELTS